LGSYQKKWRKYKSCEWRLETALVVEQCLDGIWGDPIVSGFYRLTGITPTALGRAATLSSLGCLRYVCCRAVEIRYVTSAAPETATPAVCSTSINTTLRRDPPRQARSTQLVFSRLHRVLFSHRLSPGFVSVTSGLMCMDRAGCLCTYFRHTTSSTTDLPEIMLKKGVCQPAVFLRPV
jgi:hypothetical protein